MIRTQFRNAGESTGGGGAYHLDANGNRVQGATHNFATDRLWAAALTLILVVLVLNLVARFVGRFNKVAK